MSKNKNALLRYRTIDRCLRNTARRWTLADLVDACSDALYEYEGRDEAVSLRTVQLDIQMMRSDRLGYEAPIEVYDRKYYRYSDPSYSISNRPLSQHDLDVLNRTIDLLRQFDEFDSYHEMADVVSRLQDKVAEARRPRIVDFERNPQLKGLELLNPLYDLITRRRPVSVFYQSFHAPEPVEFVLHPYLLKEYRNRWFLFGSRDGDMKLFNLALDRIVGLTPRPDLPYRANPSFTPEWFRDIVGVTKHSRLRKAVVRFEAFKEQAEYIRTKPLHTSQREVGRRGADGTRTFEVRVVVNPEFIALLMSYGNAVRVLSPRFVVDTMGGIFRSGAALYGGSDSTCPE